MINPPAHFSLDGIWRAIVKVTVLPGFGMIFPKNINKSPLFCFFKCLSDGLVVANVIFLHGGVVNINYFRGDI